MNLTQAFVQSEVFDLLERSIHLFARFMKLSIVVSEDAGLRSLLEAVEKSEAKMAKLLALEIRERLGGILDSADNLTDSQLESFQKRLDRYGNDLSNLEGMDEEEVTEFVLSLPYNLQADLVNYSHELEHHVKRRRQTGVQRVVEVADHATSFCF